MYIIQTKYYGPTDHNGARIKVTNMLTGRSKWHHWDYSVDYGKAQHEHAAYENSSAKYLILGGEDKMSYYWVAEL